jgi:type VI secretion system VasI family protein
MRSVLILAFLWAVAGPATAQETRCRTIESSAERLACYDKAAPPQSRAKALTSKESKDAGSKPAQGQDILAIENARLDSALKNICRGC